MKSNLELHSSSSNIQRAKLPYSNLNAPVDSIQVSREFASPSVIRCTSDSQSVSRICESHAFVVWPLVAREWLALHSSGFPQRNSLIFF